MNIMKNRIKREFDNELICNKKIFETKIKPYGDKVRDFHNKKMPKVGSDYDCLSVLSIDFFLKKRRKLLPASGKDFRWKRFCDIHSPYYTARFAWFTIKGLE